MTTDLVEKCARALCAHDGDHDPFPTEGYWHKHYIDAVLAVIDALADGVTEEMTDAALAATTGTNAEAAKQRDGEDFRAWGSRLRKLAIAAAIRAAKSREG